MVEWSDGQMQKVTIRSLVSEADYLAKNPPKPAQTVASLIKEKLEEKEQMSDGAFAIGEKIYLRPEHSIVRSMESLDQGEVMAEVKGHPGMFLVEWKGGRIEKLMASLLMGEEEAEQLCAGLAEAFDKVEEAVVKKLAKAAALVREANALATKAGLELINLDDGGLVSAMRDADWEIDL